MLRFDDLVKYMASLGLTCVLGGAKTPVSAKTANYTINPLVDPSETHFTNEGATGAVTFTLPAPSLALRGISYNFRGVADQNIVVSAGAGLAICLNNAAAASLACSTAGQKIGSAIRATCTGTKWSLIGEAAGVTYTVA